MRASGRRSCPPHPRDRARARRTSRAPRKSLREAKHPGIFCGWGAVDAVPELIAIAELLGAPVTTTLQGLSAFPGNHRLHAGFALGQAAVPAVENAFRDCDGLLAVGTRFAEIPTGSYGWEPPANLVHVDINPRVFGANYKPAVALEGDARAVLGLLRDALGTSAESARAAAVAAAIAKDKRAYREEWLAHDSKGRVNPQRFFDALRARLPDDGIVVADDGNHTFLVAELMPIHAPRTYFSPSDFNSMGYCIPATIGAKLARPERAVVGIVGDGAARMTGLEMSTAVAQNAGVAWFVFNDGELAQIAQAQETPYNRKTCTVLPELDFEGPRAGEPRRLPPDAGRCRRRTRRRRGACRRCGRQARPRGRAHRLLEAHAIHRGRDPHQPEALRHQGPGADHRPRAVAQGDGLISRRPARSRRPPP